MDQDLDVGRGTFKALRLRWFDMRRHRLSRTQDDDGRRDLVNGTQRENRALIVVHGRGMVIRVMRDQRVHGQMAVHDNMDVPLFLGLVHVFGRSDGEHTHHHA